MNRKTLAFVAVLVTAIVVIVVAWRPARAEDAAKNPAPAAARFAVSTHVLPGTVSMSLIYVADAQTNKLYIYRAMGGMDTSFTDDPELYRTYDLTSAGQKKLKPVQ